MQKITKKFDTLELNFNQLTELLSKHNFNSFLSSNSINQFILNTVFKITDVHQDGFFLSLIDKVCKYNNLIDKKIDAHLFVGFSQGVSSIIHRDEYDVFLYGLYGETMYIVNDEKYILQKGDLLKINKFETHQAISLKPRIILSISEI